MLKRIARRILADELLSKQRIIADLNQKLTRLNYITDKRNKLVSEIRRNLSALDEF